MRSAPSVQAATAPSKLSTHISSKTIFGAKSGAPTCLRAKSACPTKPQYSFSLLQAVNKIYTKPDAVQWHHQAVLFLFAASLNNLTRNVLMAEHQNGAQTHRVNVLRGTHPRYQMTRLADVLASIFILLEFCFRLETMLLECINMEACRKTSQLGIINFGEKRTISFREKRMRS